MCCGSLPCECLRLAFVDAAPPPPPPPLLLVRLPPPPPPGALLGRWRCTPGMICVLALPQLRLVLVLPRQLPGLRKKLLSALMWSVVDA